MANVSTCDGRLDEFEAIDSCVLADGTSVDSLRTLNHNGACLRDGSVDTVLFEPGGTLPACLMTAAAAHSGLQLYECNSTSACKASCPQRCTQQPPRTPLTIAPAPQLAVGHAVYAQQQAPTGAFLGEYTGELVSSRAGDKAKEVSAVGTHSYHLTYSEHFSKNGKSTVMRTCVDAAKRGSVMRFVNHSCEPNCVVLGVRTHNSVPRLCVFSLRVLDEGEELTLDYGAGQDDAPGATPMPAPEGGKGQATGMKQDVVSGKMQGVPCCCGSEHCRGSVPFSA